MPKLIDSNSKTDSSKTINHGPLSGIRVLDLTRYLAGPFATMLLGDYGADVIKIEALHAREFRPGRTRESYFFLSANRSKRSLTLDIKSEVGRKIFEQLLPTADVVIENFRPGVMSKLGLGAETLLEKYPELVYCGISGFGDDGPYRDRPGFDQIAQGMSGFMSLTGTSESGPTRAGLAIADLLAGLFAVQGIQLALLKKSETGRGQIVHTSLLEAMLGVLSWGAGMFFERGEAPPPAGQHHPLSSPYGRFRASDGYLNIAASTDIMWEKLADALKHPEWKRDPRFRAAPDRILNRDLLTREIERNLAKESVDHWVSKLNQTGVPCGPVLDLAQVFSDPQVLARNMLVQLPHPEIGTFRTTGLPIKLSATPGSIERRPPLHGEHTDEILAEIGVSRKEISRMRREGVI